MTGPLVQFESLAALPGIADVLDGEEPADVLRYLGLPTRDDARALVEQSRKLGALDHAQVALLELTEVVHASVDGDQAGLQRHLHRLHRVTRSWSIAARPGGVR